MRELDVRFVPAARFGILRVLRVQRRDFRTHHRTVHEIKAEQRTARVVTRVLEIAVEKRIREIDAPAHAAVHHEKGDVADQIDPTQPFAELDAVEGVNAVVESHEVRQVQIAVAFAHESLRAPRVDQRRQPSVLRFAPQFEFGHELAAYAGQVRLRDLVKIFAHRTDDRFR